MKKYLKSICMTFLIFTLICSHIIYSYVSELQTNERIKKIQYTDMEVPDIDSTNKTYMSFKSITDTTSKQWELQQSAITNGEGFRIYNGMYMIALGTYYSPSVGIEFEIELDTGKVIQCITGDIKDDKHTDKTNCYIVHNGNIVEFIIDSNSINSLSKKMGDMSYSDMEGNIVRITRIDKNK